MHLFGDDEDYGLLATAAVARTNADAQLIREQLRGAAIRSTTAATLDGRVSVLVFGEDCVRARRLLVDEHPPQPFPG